MPRGAALNRRLAWQMTGQFFLVWSGAVALTLLCLSTAWTLRPEVLRLVLPQLSWAAALGALPTVVFQWRPWSRVGAPTTSGSLGPALLLLLAAGVAWGATFIGGWSLFAVMAAMLVATVAWCATRWRRMASEPSALPVGRLA